MKNFPIRLIVIIGLCFTGCSGISDGLQHKNEDKNSPLLFVYSITVNNFKDVTYTRDVEISINPGEASEVRFSNDQINWSSWESAVTFKTWVIPGNNSVKTVYVEFRKNGITINSAYDDIEFIEKLLPETFMDHDNFGTSVAISADGTTVIMGGENFSVANAMGFTYKPGGAIIYKYDGIRWNAAVLVPNGASDGDKFGASVSLNGDGNLAIIGSPGFNDEQGRILMYRYNSTSGQWEFKTYVTGAADSCFGNSVALSRNGQFALGGAVSGNSRKGEAILYSVLPSSLSFLRAFYAADGAAEDRFGCSVSVNNDASVIVAGAEQKKVLSFTNSGKIYVFKGAGASYTQSEIIYNNPDYSFFFGCSTSVSSDGTVICAGAKGSFFEKGSVYVFRFDGTGYIQYDVLDVAGSASDQFGYSVALSADGNSVIAGSPYADIGTTDSGKLIRFNFNGSDYVRADEYFSTDPTFEKHLGISAAINDSKDVHIGGAIKDVYNLKACGTSYVFRN